MTDKTVVHGLAELVPDAAPTLPSACDRLPPWAIHSHQGVPLEVVLAGTGGRALDVSGMPLGLVQSIVEAANRWMEEQSPEPGGS